MRIIILTLTIFLTIIVLSGCSNAKIPEVKFKNIVVYKHLQYPDYLLKPCYITPPINKDVYINSTYTDKEGLLTNYVMALLTDLGQCNKQISTLKELQSKYKASLELDNGK